MNVSEFGQLIEGMNIRFTDMAKAAAERYGYTLDHLDKTIRALIFMDIVKMCQSSEGGHTGDIEAEHPYRVLAHVMTTSGKEVYETDDEMWAAVGKGNHVLIDVCEYREIEPPETGMFAPGKPFHGKTVKMPYLLSTGECAIPVEVAFGDNAEYHNTDELPPASLN